MSHPAAFAFGTFFRSPTALSWLAIAARLAGTTLTLALVVSRLSIDEISVWLLITALGTFQSIVDFGFAPTYTRILSQSYGRQSDAEEIATTATVVTTIRRTYWRLVPISLLIVPILGAIGLARPIATTSADFQPTAWASWIVVAVAYCVGTFQNQFIVILHAAGQIARQRAVESILTIASAAVNIAVLLTEHGILALAIAALAMNLLGVVAYRFSANRYVEPHLTSGHQSALNGLQSLVWSSAWRSGIGIAASLGATQFAVMAIAQRPTEAGIAQYLFGIQLMQLIALVSQPPFYSRIPQLAKLYGAKERDRIVAVANDGMQFSHWTFAGGALLVAAVGPYLLNLVNSNVGFPTATFWFTLAFAMFVERFGAMHLQLYTLTGRVIWHTINSLTGAALVALCLLLIPEMGPMGYAIAALIAYGSCYSWYTAKISYAAFAIDRIRFEFRSSLLPAMLLLSALLFSWFL